MGAFMKNNKKRRIPLRGAALITAAFLFAGFVLGCTNGSDSGGNTPMHKVIFSVEGSPANGTLEAKVDGKKITSGDSVEEGKTVEFTATPENAATHDVDFWTISEGEFDTGTGLNGSTSARIKVKQPVTVTVCFKPKSAPFSKYPVRFGVSGANGKLEAKVDGQKITSVALVESGKTVEFTATPDADYKVLKWTVTPKTALQAGGTEGASTATVKITAMTEVQVTFKFIDKTDHTYTKDIPPFTMKYIAAVTDGWVGDDAEFTNKPHKVSLSAYRIGETEVTQELWQAVMGNNPSFFDNTGPKMKWKEFDTSPDAGEEQKKRPVEQVSWYDCIAFCNKLSLKLGLEQCYTVTVGGKPIDFSKLTVGDIPTEHNRAWSSAVLDMSKNGFRLPTEAEWEWAAKGGKNDKWAGTSSESELKKYAWLWSTPSNSKTHEVKKKLPNGYGLYDMNGNVSEWCWDFSTTLPDPVPKDYAGPGAGYYLDPSVVRGGGWGTSALAATCGYRGLGNQAEKKEISCGLRLVSRP